MKNLTVEARNALIEEMERIFTTRDIAWTFLRMEFRELVGRVNLEGSPFMRAWEIYELFRKQCMVGSLIAALNAKFDTELNLDLED